MDNNQPQNHHKPNPEELEADNKRILAELEKPEEPQPSEPAPSEPEPSQPAEETPEEKPEEPQPSEPAPSEPEPSKPDEVKKHLAESTREVQRLYRNNARMNQAITDADNLPEPTEQELQSEFSDWDVMSDTEKRLATETLINKRFRETIKQVAGEQRKIDDWGDKVGKFIEDPKVLANNPELEGKQELFKQFASDKKLVGYEFDILVPAFLNGLAKTPKPSHKGEKMFEQGMGGPNEKPVKKSNKVSVEESEKIRETDYKRYRQLLSDNMIEDVV